MSAFSVSRCAALLLVELLSILVNKRASFAPVGCALLIAPLYNIRIARWPDLPRLIEKLANELTVSVRKRVGVIELRHPLDWFDIFGVKEITHGLSFTKLGGPS